MREQLSLALGPVADFLDKHSLRVAVDTRTFDPDSHRHIAFMRRYLNEAPQDARYVWVTSPHTGGQVRMYVLGGGYLRHTRPDYRPSWPELDNAVAAHLEASLFEAVFWTHSGPIEAWRMEDA